MKKFKAFWGDGYIHTGTQEKSQDFFCEANGYDISDTADICALGVGQSWIAPTNEIHCVTRLA